jgi:phage tail sheath protein FI
VKVFNPLFTSGGAEPELINQPPSGHVAGIWARVDSTRGVYKAPANEGVIGIVDLERPMGKDKQVSLNPPGINVIRPFGGSPMVYGARTLGGDRNGEYRYLNVRRFMNFLKESIDAGTQFVVFEPNSPALWQRIIRSVGDFLYNQWREGALFGATPKDAFFVKCDAETNPASEREAGRVITEIGVAVVKPAEFVIFRIQQNTGA